MDDLISRQAALHLADGGCHPANLAEEIRKLPSAVEPVIRCRDCKEYYLADNRVPEEQVWVCSFLGRVMRHDDFCSLGERKGGDAE